MEPINMIDPQELKILLELRARYPTLGHRDEILAMRQEGKTYSEIAAKFGVTRQRIYSIVRANQKRA